MKIIHNLKGWFTSKRSLIKELHESNYIIDHKIGETVSLIEELEQHKLYFINAVGEPEESIRLIKEFTDEVKKRMKWTSPKIIIINKPIEELNEKKLRDWIKQIKKRGTKP